MRMTIHDQRTGESDAFTNHLHAVEHATKCLFAAQTAGQEFHVHVVDETEPEGGPVIIRQECVGGAPFRVRYSADDKEEFGTLHEALDAAGIELPTAPQNIRFDIRTETTTGRTPDDQLIPHDQLAEALQKATNELWESLDAEEVGTRPQTLSVMAHREYGQETGSPSFYGMGIPAAEVAITPSACEHTVRITRGRYLTKFRGRNDVGTESVGVFVARKIEEYGWLGPLWDKVATNDLDDLN